MMAHSQHKLLIANQPTFYWYYLLERGPLTDWEAGFLKSVQRQKELSDKQVAALKRIIKKYFTRTDV